jgi:hypothetical protein
MTSAARLVWRAAVVLGACALATALVACSGTAPPPAQPGSGATSATAPKEPFAPVVAVSELAVGDNRFALGIIDQATGQPLPDARVRLRFFTVQGNQGTFRSEADAAFVAPARDAGVPPLVPHRHPDGSIHQHVNAEADVGVYVANVRFEQAGDWGVEALFQTADGREGRVAVPFKVAEQPSTPAIGSHAPRTRNLTARDVKDLSEISSAIDPVPAFHQESVAEAIAAGRPALVAFVTPGYCSTRFCGPAYEVMKKLLPAYQDKAALIHVEIYKDPLTKTYNDAVREWRLQSEPYFFVVDRNGIITAKFEGPTSLAELDEALRKVTS